jgi:hypothetical protein
MLAWLRERGHVTLNLPGTECIAAQLSKDDLDTFDFCVDGDTLPEAVARLVVAVAEREAGKYKDDHK